MRADVADCSVLCVDIGGSSTKAGVLGPNGEIRHVSSIPTKPDADAFIDELATLIAETKASAERESRPVPAQLGVAVAGFLDEERNYLVYNSNFSWLEGYPLSKQLKER